MKSPKARHDFWGLVIKSVVEKNIEPFPCVVIVKNNPFSGIHSIMKCSCRTPNLAHILHYRNL